MFRATLKEKKKNENNRSIETVHKSVIYRKYIKWIVSTFSSSLFFLLETMIPCHHVSL